MKITKGTPPKSATSAIPTRTGEDVAKVGKVPAAAPAVVNNINTGSARTLRSTAGSTIKYLAVIGTVIGGAFALGFNKLTVGSGNGNGKPKPFLETVADSIGVSPSLPQWLRTTIAGAVLLIVVPLALYLIWQLGKASAR